MAIPIPSGATGDDGEVEFIDEPLDPVVQDNIEIDCIIGNNPYDVVSMEIHLTDGSDSNYAKGKIVPDGHDFLPSNGLNSENPADIIKVDVDNEISVARDDTSGEITRLFTGVISNASRIENGLFEFMAFWPGFNEIQNGDLTVDPALPAKEFVNSLSDTFGGVAPSIPDFSNRRQYTNSIADRIGSFVTDGGPRYDLDSNFELLSEFGYTVNLTTAGFDINGSTAGFDIEIAFDSANVPLTEDGPSEGMLERVVKATNSRWLIDRYGHFHIGPPIPNGDVPTAVNSYKLRYITDTTAGKQSPAWRSVAVIGDGIVSQDGWSSSAQINENPEKFSAPITGEERVEEGTLAEPTFVYTNLEIDTRAEAENVLQKLRDEIKKQTAGGKVTVVGHPEVWPGDAIELPDTENQPFASERFAVGKVTHFLNNDDGFLTEIECMGLTNGAETTFSDDPDFPNDRYDNYFTDEELERVQSGPGFSGL